MLRQKLIINIWLLHLVGFLPLHPLLTMHGHRNLNLTNISCLTGEFIGSRTVHIYNVCPLSVMVLMLHSGVRRVKVSLGSLAQYLKQLQTLALPCNHSSQRPKYPGMLRLCHWVLQSLSITSHTTQMFKNSLWEPQIQKALHPANCHFQNQTHELECW